MVSDTFKEFWTYLYKDVYKENDFLFMVGGTGLPLGILFWTVCGLLGYVDLKGKPKWMLKYKVQPGVNQPVRRRHFWHAMRVVTFNHLCVTGPYLMLLYRFQKYMGCSCRPEDLPSNGKIIYDIVRLIILEEIGFYYTHRLCHWGPLYRNVHKKHHEWTAPMGIICVYCHPIEHIFCNLMPITLSGALLGSHMLTMLIWYSFAMIGTIIHHSGYHLPFIMSPEFHDYHHLKYNWNYGALGLMDWLHGTDSQYLKSKQHLRHKHILGFKSARELYPDDDKTNKKED